MPKITFRFYEELNDFLPRHRRKADFEAVFKGKRSIKDMIESLGVPHTEVDLILVDGKSVDFNYILQNKDRVSVYTHVVHTFDTLPEVPTPLPDVQLNYQDCLRPHWHTDKNMLFLYIKEFLDSRHSRIA